MIHVILHNYICHYYISYKGIKITSSVDLTHIMFVDNVVMMGERSWENLKEA